MEDVRSMQRMWGVKSKEVEFNAKVKKQEVQV